MTNQELQEAWELSLREHSDLPIYKVACHLHLQLEIAKVQQMALEKQVEDYKERLEAIERRLGYALDSLSSAVGYVSNSCAVATGDLGAL